MVISAFFCPSPLRQKINSGAVLRSTSAVFGERSAFCSGGPVGDQHCPRDGTDGELLRSTWNTGTCTSQQTAISVGVALVCAPDSTCAATNITIPVLSVFEKLNFFNSLLG